MLGFDVLERRSAIARYLILTVLLGLGCSTAALYLSSPYWIVALWGTGACIGLIAALLIALTLQRLRPGHWLAPSALLLALAATAIRVVLVAATVVDPSATGSIAFGSMTLAISTVVWGVLALVWGSLGIADALESPARDRARRWDLLSSAAAVTLGLYAVGPLWSLLGLTLSVWTAVWLFVLAITAYGSGCAYRWIAGRLGGEGKDSA